MVDLISTDNKIQKGDIIVLMSSNADKHFTYRDIFHAMGINFLSLDELGRANAKTPEQNNDNMKNSEEKLLRMLGLLNEELVRYKLSGNYDDPSKLNDKEIWAVTEDSSFIFKLDNENQQKRFNKLAYEKIASFFPSNKYAEKIKVIEDQGFPGVNMKPIMEELPGGFPQMMDIIYDCLDEVGYEGRPKNLATVTMTAARLSDTAVSKQTVNAEYYMPTRKEFKAKFDALKPGQILDFSHIQKIPGEKDDYVIDDLHEDRIDEILNVPYHRTDIVKKLVDESLHSGEDHEVKHRKKPKIKFGLVSADMYEENDGDKDISIPRALHNNGISTEALSSIADIRNNPTKRLLDGADVGVVVPSDDAGLNNQMLLDVLIDMMNEPETMRKTAIVDNRSGKFDGSMEMITEKFKRGLHFGKIPLEVVNKGESLEKVLHEAENSPRQQRTLHVDKEHFIRREKQVEPVPDDGIFTVAIFGGHANNAQICKKEAYEVAYYAASQGWRVVTGGGVVEGPMGAAHTGFIQYHLDRLREDIKAGYYSKNELDYYRIDELYSEEGGRYDAEEIIEKDPQLLELLADANIIPKDLFYAYSTDYFLKSESFNEQPPPAVTFFDCGNIQVRLKHLMNHHLGIWMTGSFGSDQELQAKIEINQKGDEAAYAGLGESGPAIVHNRGEVYNETLKINGIDPDDRDSSIGKAGIMLSNDKNGVADISRVTKGAEKVFAASGKRAASYVQRVSEEKEKSKGADDIALPS